MAGLHKVVRGKASVEALGEELGARVKIVDGVVSFSKVRCVLARRFTGHNNSRCQTPYSSVANLKDASAWIKLVYVKE